MRRKVATSGEVTSLPSPQMEENVSGCRREHHSQLEYVLEIRPFHTLDTTPADSEAPADLPNMLLGINPSPVYD
ncbi:hypothetical protein DPMN_141872 [Dreissena polymorpha]|uniref:Uncharacterized protein n=1 Tax=Dreissena polymorpha TaxID=45954 RepID=A0A9D4GDG9_DREPO|nr:hypothetical protein DPMN_141872 [Dreissena polymorpha]